VLHLLEGPSYSLLRILNNLNDLRYREEEPTVQSESIVYCIEDCPKRFFPEWYSTTIRERKSAVEEVVEDNCKDIVFEIVTDLLEIGNSLQSVTNEKEVELSR
jgi:hypothetical protein